MDEYGIDHIWSCRCGEQTPCSREDTLLHAIFTCPGCKTTWHREDPNNRFGWREVPNMEDPKDEEGKARLDEYRAQALF